MTTPKKWVITTADPKALPDVERRLRAAGFSVEQVLLEIGSITGAASDEVATQARTMPGVVDVSPDAPITLPSPDTPTTW